MPAIKKDQQSQQPPVNLVQQPTQFSQNPDLTKANNKVPETEENDVLITDQRRPQFRSSENHVRRNF